MQEPQEMWVRSLGQEDPLEEGMATHSSILAWRIPWTAEAGPSETSLFSHLLLLRFPHRHQPRLRGSRRHRRQETTVRHLGQNREPSESDGQHRGQRQDPGPGGDLPHPEGPGLCL